MQRVAHYPAPGMNMPAAVRFSPDEHLLTYLWSEDGSLVRQLWAFDLESGEIRQLVRPPGQGDTDATVSAEEALRRERLRMRGFGVTNYEWAGDRPVLLVPMLGRLYVSHDHGEHLIELATEGEVIDPHLSPSGDAVAYVHEGELWLVESREGARPRRLTFDASSPEASGERLITNGLAEFIAQEEVGRSSGFWWSRDGTQIAFTQVDVSQVARFIIPHDTEDPPSAETHCYPFAGTANARVRLGILDLDGSPVRWLPLDRNEEAYLARVDWAPDGKLFVQLESRDQRRLDLIECDPMSAAIRGVVSERAETWINLHDDLRFLQAKDAPAGEYDLLWSSERSGFRHLYRYDRNGEELAQLTDGDWPVDRVIGTSDGYAYFLAGVDSPLERQVYRVRWGGGRPERVSHEAGMHAAQLAPASDLLADLWDSANHAPSLVLIRPGAERRAVFLNQAREPAQLGLTPPEFLTVPADDGTILHAALYRPPSQTEKPSPLIVSVYGGPHVQQVANTWGMTADLRAQYLARQGYFVLKLDNRGSARRGHAFEAAILGDMGNLEVQDQVAGVRAVSELPGVDGSRVGVYGWSYGGYMAAMCLLRAPNVFRAGVAGAPVTDWGGYDTHYTERYMGTPEANPAGYRDSSALHHAGALEGHLLLVHGMLDENVHFRHSVRLVDALIAAGKPFRLLPFPHERHMPRREEDRCFMEEQVVQHFRRYL